jgi:hypothetical protein
VIAVELPSTRSEVRYMPSFHADLPLFALAMGDLSAFHFGDFILKSTHSSIEVEVLVLKFMPVWSLSPRRKSLPTL